MSKVRMWPLGIFALLGLNMAIVATTVVFATTTDSAVVESRPYERALHWDQERQQRAMSDQLHWTCRASLAVPSTGASDAALQLVFTDASGSPVTGLTVKASVFHHAHAAQQVSVEAVSTAATPGVYAAMLVAPKGSFKTGLPLGLWRVSVVATRPAGATDTDTFECDQDVMLLINESIP